MSLRMLMLVAGFVIEACGGGSAAPADATVDVVGIDAPPADLFQPKVDLMICSGCAAVWVAIGDVDGDAKPDVVVSSLGVSGMDHLLVFLNTAATGATTPSFSPLADFPNLAMEVATGDLNGDGKQDLVAVNDSGIVILLSTTPVGATSATFTSAFPFVTGPGGNAGSVHLAIADLNSDGKVDVVVANNDAGTVSVLLNTTTPGSLTPSFATELDLTTGISPRGVAVGDFNGDGKPDVAVAARSTSMVEVFLNTTAMGSLTASFSPHLDFATAAQPETVVAGDINGDGRPDLVVGNGNNQSIDVSLLLDTTASGALVPSFAMKVEAPPRASNPMTLGDIDGDGRPDLIATDIYGGSAMAGIVAYLNVTPTAAPTPSFSAAHEVATGLPGGGVAAGDLNGDGRADVVKANGSTVSVLLAR